eukprot:scaffold265641_cov36-Prasinocladus_malaysianus.AAC.1
MAPLCRDRLLGSPPAAAVVAALGAPHIVPVATPEEGYEPAALMFPHHRGLHEPRALPPQDPRGAAQTN